VLSQGPLSLLQGLRVVNLWSFCPLTKAKLWVGDKVCFTYFDSDDFSGQHHG
jgi:hypothetical protein